MKYKYLLTSSLVFFFGTANAGELGVGNDDPHAAPAEPTTSESTGGGLFEQLTEWFELDNDSE